jgi:hypothetical protein
MPHDSQETPVHRSLPQMLSRYLQQRTAAAESGLISAETGEVIPFESAPVPPVDSRVAWDEAVAAASYYEPARATQAWKVPVEWPTLVATSEPVMALPFCLGNFPQLVRDLHTLMQARDFTTLQPARGRPANASLVEASAQEALRQKQYGRFLLAIGTLRLAKQLDLAEALLEKHRSDIAENHQAGWANERAAVAWHQGKPDDAAARWLAQEPTVPVLFNRGMAALFSNRTAEAKPALVGAVEQLPDDSAWHHLGRLYLALASMAR